MNGILLGLDTSTEAVGIGVARVDGEELTTLLSAAPLAPRRANTVLLSHVTEALRETDVELDEVAAVIVGCGPGSFTGVRIGVSAAKGLAQGLGVPLYGVSTLEAIAWNAVCSDLEGTVGVVGDAMRGEVYPALFESASGGLVRSTPDRVAKPADVASEWAGEVAGDILILGNGLTKYEDTFSAALGSRARVVDVAQWYPTGDGLFSAWWRARVAGDLGPGDPAGVLPVYTRLSDAEENERARRGLSAIRPPCNGVMGEPIVTESDS